MFFKYLCFFGFFLGISFSQSKAQTNIGTPIIHSFPKETFQGGLQSWDIEQGKDGKMYFANNQGLLVFDGVNWKIWSVPNNTIVRSLLLDNNKIYVGSQGDFGYFEPNKQGVLQYTSLLSKFPSEQRQISDVWDILKVEDKILFRTHKKLFQYDGEIRLLESSNSFSLMTAVENEVFIASSENGLSKFINGKLSASKIKGLKGIEMRGACSLEGDLTIALENKGIFKLKQGKWQPWFLKNNEFIKSHRINCIQKLNQERFALGTLTGGLFIIDQNGNVLQHIDAQNGLLANEILDIYKDGLGNIWLALNNGIAYVEINSPFSIILPDSYMESSGYAVKIHKEKIYFGTSNGLYQANWKDYYNPLSASPFELITNTKGQVWGLDIKNDQLLLSHNQGAFKILDKKALPIKDNQGSWGFIQLQSAPEYLIEGTYFGLNLYKYNDKNLEFLGAVANLPEESCRILATDNFDNVWVSHPYRGVYKIQIDIESVSATSVDLYDEETGFPSNWVNVFDIGNGVVFTSENGIYVYDNEVDKFSLSKEWNKIFPKESKVQRLIPDALGNIWFVENNQVGVVRIKDLGIDKVLEKEVFPKLNDKLVGGFESIYTYNNENVFFPVERGFVHFNPLKYKATDSLFNVHIQEVSIGDSIAYGGWYDNELDSPIFNYSENNFKFKYAATDYSDAEQISYQFKLKGLEDNWSKWKSTNIKEYTELPSGEYEFLIKAKNARGVETKSKSFSFEIMAPWYYSNIAKIAYGILIFLVLSGLIFIPRKQFENKTAELKKEQEQKIVSKTKEYEEIVEKSKAEISELQAEKMKTEIQFKNQELATTTMHLVQKGVLLTKLKENLSNILRNPLAVEIQRDIKGTIQLLDYNSQLDEDWDQFAKYFDEVHVDFIKRLKESYPQLTSKDQRMCTYLRMNLSTKEIVPLLNISVRGVEVSRYRLRKKLDLDKSVNLNDFLMKF